MNSSRDSTTAPHSHLELEDGQREATCMKPNLTAASDDDASAASSTFIRPVNTSCLSPSDTEPHLSVSIGSVRRNRKSAAEILRSYLWFFCITLPILLVDLLQLLLFSLALSPAFAHMVWFYFGTAHRTSVRYGHASVRQTLDVYSRSSTARNPARAEGQQKVVLFFCCGGAWTIGYKMWGALLARVMVRTGMDVVLPDYRNYPWGSVPDAVEDVEAALQWVQQNYVDSQIVLVGQSAGGHLLMTMLLRQAMRRKSGTADMRSPAAGVKGMIALAAPLQLDRLPVTFQKHGMSQKTINDIFDGQVADYDPYELLARLLQQETTAPTAHQLLPPIALYHGSRDRTVPVEGSLAFLQRLQEETNNTCRISFETYEGWSHTDPILEGPAAADHRFHLDIFRRMVEWTTDNDSGSSSGLEWPSHEQDQAVLRRMCPQALVALARWCVPF